jgi:signal transduction histidine kinase
LRALAGRLAHQLRNPLAAVKAACGGLHAELDDPDHLDRLELTLHEVDRMLAHVTSTVQSVDDLSEKAGPVDLLQEVQAVIAIMQLGHAIRIDPASLTQQQPPKCQLPRTKFRVALFSLFDQLSRSAGTIHISIEVESQGDRAHLNIVVPSGPHDAAYTQNTVEPSGIGLLVAERFARDHGGKLSRMTADHSLTLTLDFPCNHV